MCVFLPRRHLSGQLEVELSGFAGLRLGVEDRCLDLSIDQESDFISANCEAIANVMAGGIRLDDLGKISRFNADISAFDWTLAGVFHDPFNRRASPDGDRYKQ